jgi:hypothetical protein
VVEDRPHLITLTLGGHRKTERLTEKLVRRRIRFGGDPVSSEPWELTEAPSRFDEYNWYSDDVPARKFYLFLAEIGRRLRHLMTDPGPINMIDFCEQCAEGQITEDELSDLSDEHRPNSPGQSYASNVADNLYWWVADRYKVNSRSFYYAANAFAAQAAVDAGLLSPQAHYHEEVQTVLGQPNFAAACERTAQEWGALVRDIYGPNPFRTPAFDLKWRTPTVLGISCRIYEERDFGAMPVLADALEDAGCDDTDFLAHCRSPGGHVRGCWALDLLLAKW